jgi:hypothetical protein
VDIEMPMASPVVRGSHVLQCATLPGQWVVPPGDILTCLVNRDASDDAAGYGAWFVIDGYLTQKP